MTTFSSESAWRWSDVLGYATDGTLRLAIEIKPRIHIQDGVVSKAKQWLYEIGQQRPELYALFVAPEFIVLRLPALYRRRQVDTNSFSMQLMLSQLLTRLDDEADYIVDAAACLDLAIDTSRVPLAKLDHEGLKQVVTSWLQSCLVISAPELLEQPAQAWIIDSGLYQVLRSGTIVPVTEPRAYALAG